MLRLSPLFLLLAAVAAQALPVTLHLEGTPLTEAAAAVARAADVPVTLAPDLPATRVSVDFDAVPADRALARLVAMVPGVTLAKADGGYRLVPVAEAPAPKPVPAAAPAAPVARPAPAQQAADGSPRVSSSGWTQIRLEYLDAPGLATILGGQGLRLSDIDPWALRAPNTGSRGNATAVFARPAGLRELVGVDWLNSLLAR